MYKLITSVIFFSLTIVMVSTVMAGDEKPNPNQQSCEFWCDAQYDPLETTQENVACRKGCALKSSSDTGGTCDDHYLADSVQWKACREAEKHE